MKEWFNKNYKKLLYVILVIGMCACVSRATFLITKEYTDSSHTEIVINPKN